MKQSKCSFLIYIIPLMGFLFIIWLITQQPESHSENNEQKAKLKSYKIQMDKTPETDADVHMPVDMASSVTLEVKEAQEQMPEKLISKNEARKNTPVKIQVPPPDTQVTRIIEKVLVNERKISGFEQDVLERENKGPVIPISEATKNWILSVIKQDPVQRHFEAILVLHPDTKTWTRFIITFVLLSTPRWKADIGVVRLKWEFYSTHHSGKEQKKQFEQLFQTKAVYIEKIRRKQMQNPRR